MRKIISVVALLCVVVSASAQSMGFLLVSGDAASSGIAGASIAMPGSAYAPDLNMAAAALSAKKMDAAAGYTLWSPSFGKNGLVSASGYFKATDKLAIGADWKHFSIPAYQIVSAEGRITGSYTPKEFAVGLGASYQIIPGLAAGVHLKFVSSVMADNAKGSAFGADISLQYQLNGLRAGVALDNLGSKVKYGSNAYAMPMRVRAGASYSIVGVTATAEAQLVSGSFMAALGAQYAFKDMLFVRAGYHLGTGKAPIPSHLALGLGAKFAGVHLDVSYWTASETLANTLAFTLGYTF
ncbi:MAG: PorV/PorQ family protein [Bacteroidales bacterium]|nr:PorV/PorQ family protein [Bacteroidales bacterium]